MTQQTARELKESAFAFRPALEDLRNHQRVVLETIGRAFTDEDTLVRWKADVVQATAGRTSDGLRAILADPELSVLTQRWLLPPPQREGEGEAAYRERLEAAYEARLTLREALIVEFAAALEDFSRLPATEYIPNSGIHRAPARAASVPVTEVV